MVYFLRQENPFYPITLSSRSCTDILHYESISFLWEDPVLISLSLPVCIWRLSILPSCSEPTSLAIDQGSLSWRGQVCSACRHSLSGCWLTVAILNQRRGVCLELVPKPQSNLPAVSERSSFLQQLNLSARCNTDKRKQFFFLFNLQLNCTVGQTQSLSLP